MPAEKTKTVKVKALRDFPYRMSAAVDAPIMRANRGKEVEVLEKDVAALRKSGRIE